jgi:mannitol/fructose-specific phosphotransferase system IIA component (Ntr-type)
MDRIEPIPLSQLLEARDCFHAMLQQKTKEVDWQRFFSAHPHVLSRSLPLRVEPSDIVPLGRPGRTEPDFIFYPKKKGSPPLFGMLELKRPDSPIITVKRRNVAQLSSDAETAVGQLCQYAQRAKSIIPAASETTMFLGNHTHLFAIMGRSSELIAKLSAELFRDMIEQRLPGNLQILPYDVLLQRFELSLPPRILILVPASPAEPSAAQAASYETIVIPEDGQPRMFLAEHAVHGHPLLDNAVFEVGVEAASRWEAIPKLLKVMFHRTRLKGWEVEGIEAAVKRREASMSTGIGFGVAIPSGYTDCVTAIQAGFFRCRQPIAWDSIDNHPVTLVACWVERPGQPVEHLRLLANLANMLQPTAWREAANRAQTVEEWRQLVVTSLASSK